MIFRSRLFRTFALACLFIASFICSVTAFAQAGADAKKPADTRSQLLKETDFQWKRAQKWTLSYIDAMPEDAINFQATPEVRRFAEQMLHLAYWNYGLAEPLIGKPNPFGNG